MYIYIYVSKGKICCTFCFIKIKGTRFINKINCSAQNIKLLYKTNNAAEHTNRKFHIIYIFRVAVSIHQLE